MTITATPYAIATGGTNLINFSLTEVNTVVSSIAFANPEIHFCYVPKVIQLGGDTTICAQTLFTLTNILSTKFDHYLWSNGDTTESIDISSSGKYWLQGIDNCEMSPVSDTIIISIVPGFNVDLGGDKGICENESLLLSAGACDSCSFLWSTGGKGDSLIIATKGSYWLQVTNKFGCITSDTMFVDSSLCECDMFFPNAFTPNDDDLNERFAAKYYCDLVNYHLSVFNRWGQQVFESIDPEKGWDGRLEGQAAPEGVYIYYVNYTPVIRGMKGKQIFKTGIVSVVN
jgi:gliding motility-associated-like protein